MLSRLPSSPSLLYCRRLLQASTTTRKFASRKRLDVAIVGSPNSGKSQLLNALTNSHVAAVSRKSHTTRHDILAARTQHDTQIVFVDTPGFLRQDSKKLSKDLKMSFLRNIDYTLLVVDAARRLTDEYRQDLIELMMHALEAQGRAEDEPSPRDQKFAVVLNKVDLVKPKPKLIELAMEIGDMADLCIYNQLHPDAFLEQPPTEGVPLEIEYLMKVAPPTFYVSALLRDNLDLLLDHLLDVATPTGVEWPVDPTQATDEAMEVRVTEMIREKLYRCLHREVPHSIKQRNRKLQVEDEVIHIKQDLLVQTKSHHRLVLGKNGMTLGRIREAAERDLAKEFGKRIVLELGVKRVGKQKPQSDSMSEFQVDYFQNTS